MIPKGHRCYEAPGRIKDCLKAWDNGSEDMTIGGVEIPLENVT